MTTHIMEIEGMDLKLLEDLNALLPQLSPAAGFLEPERLQKIIDRHGSYLLVAVSGQQIVGCLTLTVYPVLTEMRAWIDDVIVSASARGQGIGRQLMVYGMQKARALGAETVNLTCHPRRREATALYLGMGFQQRDTNVFVYRFGA